MKRVPSAPPVGISLNWPTRETLLAWYDKVTPWSMDDIEAYNSSRDADNIRNLLPHSSYYAVGARLRFNAEALALRGHRWEQTMRDALGYLMLGYQMNYFWHVQFRKLFPEHRRPLRCMPWESMTESMAMAFVLGRIEEGTYQGYLTHAALNQTFQLQHSYDDRHRCGHAFMLRLFAGWRGEVSHAWGAYAYQEPIYEAILEHWQEPNPKVLEPLLLAACDRHTHQSQPDTESVFYDFSSTPRMPLEILFLLRLREIVGLDSPQIGHPLMSSPFDRLPEPQRAYSPDEFVLATLSRVHKDWPNYDSSTSAKSLLVFAGACR